MDERELSRDGAKQLPEHGSQKGVTVGTVGAVLEGNRSKRLLSASAGLPCTPTPP